METKNKSLGQKARAGFGWNLLGSFLKQFFTVIVSILIARILGPEEYGIVAIAMIFITFSEIFIDVGFTDGIIQKENISKEALSSVFIVNFSISCILALIIYLSAPYIGYFFDTPEVVPVIRYLQFILPISALGKVHSAILIKELRMKALSVRDVISSLIGGCIGIIAAYAGYGVYSLVWQQLSTVLLSTILLWIGSNWLPRLKFSWVEIKGLLSFSSYVFFDALSQRLINKLELMFIGKTFSPTTLGLYTRADSLVSLINKFTTNSLSKVIYPVFTNLQNNKEKFRDVFSKTMYMAIFASTLISGIMFFSAELIIISLLGEKWRQSILFFQILIFLTISFPLRTIVFKAILSLGYSSVKLKLGLINNVIKLLSIPIGYFFGIEAFAWMVVVGRFLIVIVTWYFFQKLVQFKLHKIFTLAMVPVLVLFFWTIVYLLDIVKVNMLLYLPAFIITYFLLIKMTNNLGYVYFRRELLSFINKRK